MKFSPVEWSPHLFTQPTKDDNDDAVVIEVVSVDSSTSSSPIRRRDSTGASSMSSTNSLSCSSSSFLDDTSISFQSLSLQQPSPNQMMGPNEKENRATKRRIVKAIRNASSRNQQEYTSPPPPQDISPVSVSSFFSNDRIDDGDCKTTLQVRDQSLFCSTESRTVKTRPSSSDFICSETLLQPKEAFNSMSFVSLQASSTLARSERQRGGSDFCMAVADEGDLAADMTISSVDRRKRRRFNRNRAMNAQEFDAILCQISNTGYLSVKNGIF